jgi:hypothetical protein
MTGLLPNKALQDNAGQTLWPIMILGCHYVPFRSARRFQFGPACLSLIR